ncbi:hypothetical protein, partial [uncultured Phascolarctobacterium sp.]|uniref:hypothetical protein n=1 Tax=uncultured Phascolarctobacterium sp. TaxID=512296 RepID=UPI002635FCF7
QKKIRRRKPKGKRRLIFSILYYTPKNYQLQDHQTNFFKKRTKMSCGGGRMWYYSKKEKINKKIKKMQFIKICLRL